jgi:hypothetical protein
LLLRRLVLQLLQAFLAESVGQAMHMASSLKIQPAQLLHLCFHTYTAAAATVAAVQLCSLLETFVVAAGLCKGYLIALSFSGLPNQAEPASGA